MRQGETDSWENEKRTLSAVVRLSLAFRHRVVYPAESSIMVKREKIIPIILAAGSSHRLGIPKPLAEFAGKTAVRIAVDNCSFLGRPLVVLGCDAKRVRPGVPRATRVIVNKCWRDGQLSSLLRALKLVPSSAAILIYPVDLPLLRKWTIQQLVRAFRNRKFFQEIVMPRHRRTYGHPIIISAALKSELAEAESAREVVYRIQERIRGVTVDSSEIYDDFHTLETYRKCLRKYKARN